MNEGDSYCISWITSLEGYTMKWGIIILICDEKMQSDYDAYWEGEEEPDWGDDLIIYW